MFWDIYYTTLVYTFAISLAIVTVFLLFFVLLVITNVALSMMVSGGKNERF